MRLPRLDSGALPPPAAGVATPGSLLGSWSATRWEYQSPDGRRVDLVAELGGVVTAGFSADAWVLTFTIPGRGVRSTGGTLGGEASALVLRAEGSEPVLLRVHLSGDTLTWNDDHSGWDFDGDGVDEPASLIAVFVRL
jgi:hypothetical protein